MSNDVAASGRAIILNKADPGLEVTPSMVPASSTRSEALGSLASRAVKLMLYRQIVMQLLSVGIGIILARKLGPATFGLFTIATFLVQTVGLLGNFGFGAALVQRRGEITKRDLAVVFTIQQSVILFIVCASWLVSPAIAHLYVKAPPGLEWLIKAVSFNLFLTSWRAMSQLQLERAMRFSVIALVDVAETACYQGVALVLALLGHGVWSLVWATLFKGIVGFAIAFAAAPWKPRLTLDRVVALEILRIGIPFQITYVIESINNWVTPLLVGTLIGPQSVGYLTWANSNGKKPLILVEALVRVSFPHFSRLQDNRLAMEGALKQYLTWSVLAGCLWASLIFSAGKSAVSLLYGEKWIAATPALILCAFAVVVDCVQWLVGQSVNAIGRVAATARRTLLRSILNLSISIPLVLWIGFIGVPIGYLLAYTVATVTFFGPLGLGSGSLRRVLLPVAWCLIPLVTACLAGFLAQLALHPYRQQLLLTGILQLITAALTFVVSAWFSAPSWVRLRASKTLRLPGFDATEP